MFWFKKILKTTRSWLFLCLHIRTTDKLQPLDLSVNKAVKDLLLKRFRHWYAQ